MKKLLAIGADPNYVFDYGDQRPIIIAADSDIAVGDNNHDVILEMVAILLEMGADPNAKDSDGRTAINKAENNGYMDVVDLLESI